MGYTLFCVESGSESTGFFSKNAMSFPHNVNKYRKMLFFNYVKKDVGLPTMLVTCVNIFCGGMPSISSANETIV
jgi:hypothetical protein